MTRNLTKVVGLLVALSVAQLAWPSLAAAQDPQSTTNAEPSTFVPSLGNGLSFAPGPDQQGSAQNLSTPNYGTTLGAIVAFGMGLIDAASLRALLMYGTTHVPLSWVTGKGKEGGKDRSAFAFQAGATPSGSLRWSPDLVAEIGYFHSDTAITFSAGPGVTVTPGDGKVEFFGQFLVGGLHFAGFQGQGGGIDFMLMPGGGVFIAVPHHRFHIFGELDFPIDFFSGGHQVFKAFSGGVAFPIG